MKRLLIALTLMVMKTVPVEACDRLFQGVYTRGHEVRSFQPCHSRQVFWVSASSWVQAPLNRFLETRGAGPYRQVYLEFRGQLLNEAVDGFAQDYDGLVRISETYRISEDIPAGCVD